MQVRVPGRHPSSGRSHYEALLDQVRLKYILYRAALFADGGGDTLDADGATIELFDNRPQQAPVQRIEAVRIDLQHVHGGFRHLSSHYAIAFDLCKVTHPAQQAIRNARRATSTGRDCSRSIAIYR